MRATHTTRRIRQIQDDLKHCAPPDRHVATQIATWPQYLTCIQKKNARNTYYAQDKSDSGRPQTLRAPRSPRGHPDRHVATRFNMYSEEKCAQHILRAVVGQEENHPISPASSGWSDDKALGCILHPSTSRCWWREGELSPSEYGNAGAHPQT